MTGEKDLIGTTLAERWEVLDTLGRGGMGSVFKARHVHLGTDVAIKVLQHTARLGQLDIARFYRESQLIASLRHDHIVRVQDTGKTPSGDLFFVMEYLQGPNLRGLLRSEGPLTWARARAIILQVCDALQFIHDNGMIHRDLKPQNIVLDPRRDHPDFVKLLDFGVAKPLADDRQDLTQTGIVLGTLPYMAQEYLSGAPPDRRIDIYALGVITFELVTGHLPSPSPFANARELQRRGAPAAAHEVIARATAPDPEYRYPDAESFASALKAVLDEADGEIDETTARRLPALSALAFASRGATPPSAGPLITTPLETDALEVVETQAQDLAGPPKSLSPSLQTVLAPAQAPSAERVVPVPADESPLSPQSAPVAPSEGSALLPNEAVALAEEAPALSPASDAARPANLTRPHPTRAPTQPEPQLRSRTARNVGLALLGVGALAALSPLWPKGAGSTEPPAPDTPPEPPPEPLPELERDRPPAEPRPVEPTQPSATTTGEVADESDQAAPEPPAPPPAESSTSPSPSSLTGAASYRRKERRIKQIVRECGEQGVDKELTLGITIDGQTGHAEAEVRAPAIAIGEPASICVIRAIQALRFAKFAGGPFKIEKKFKARD